MGLCLAVWLVSRTVLALAPADRMDFADGLFSRGLYELAIQEYLGVLRDPPGKEDLPRVYFRLGDAYRRQGNRAAADHFYRRLIEEFPDRDERLLAEFRRAELFLEADQSTDAARLFRELVERDPPEELRAAALYYLGYSRARTGHLESAEQTFRRLLEEQADAPHAPLARLDLADILRATGRLDEAADMYRAVTRSKEPDFVAEAIFHLADLAFRVGDYSAAALLYERLLGNYPEHPRAREADRAAAWSFHHDGRHAAVLELASTPTRERDGEALAEWLYLSANSRRLLMDSDGAWTEYEQLLEHDPEGPYAQAAAYESALLALGQGAHEEAIRRASKVALDGEQAPDLHWILAEAYVGADDPLRAIQYLRRLLDRFPDHPRAGDAGYRLGRILQQREQWADASSVLSRMADRYPDHARAPAARLASGHARARQGDWEGAVAEWTRLMETAPDHALAEEALFRRALAEARLDRNEAALDSLRALRMAYPGSRFGVEAAYWMGVWYDQADETDEAEKELCRALALEPPPDWDRRIRLALAGVLRRAGRMEETADLLYGLLATPMRTELAPDLLEWLTRWWLDATSPHKAEAAAQAILAHPNATAGQQARAGFLLGRARAEQGEIEAAIDTLKTALEGSGRQGEALEARLRLGRLLVGQARWEEAEAAFAAVVEEAAESGQSDLHADALFELGNAAEQSGDPEAAARYFMGMGILFDDPEQSPHALYRAVRCYEALDRSREAAAARRDLSERYPDSPWHQRLRNAEP